jgi:hypothetical protein
VAHNVQAFKKLRRALPKKGPKRQTIILLHSACNIEDSHMGRLGIGSVPPYDRTLLPDTAAFLGLETSHEISATSKMKQPREPYVAGCEFQQQRHLCVNHCGGFVGFVRPPAVMEQIRSNQSFPEKFLSELSSLSLHLSS